MTADGARPTEPSPAAVARRLLRGATTAALATAASTAGGWPYASLALLAVDHDASPILLISDLAEHSRNIAADNRVSVLVAGDAGLDDPLDGPRASLKGRAERSDDSRHRARFLARHPTAAVYADFRDFHVWRVAAESAHFVAGFDRIHTIAASDLLYDAPRALAAAEADILAHMNDDHADAVALYARTLLGARGKGARLIGIDPEGCDIRVGARVMRLDFDRTIADAQEARAILIELADGARGRTGDRGDG